MNMNNNNNNNKMTSGREITVAFINCFIHGKSNSLFRLKIIVETLQGLTVMFDLFIFF